MPEAGKVPLYTWVDTSLYPHTCIGDPLQSYPIKGTVLPSTGSQSLALKLFTSLEP